MPPTSAAALVAVLVLVGPALPHSQEQRTLLARTVNVPLMTQEELHPAGAPARRTTRGARPRGLGPVTAGRPPPAPGRGLRSAGRPPGARPARSAVPAATAWLRAALPPSAAAGSGAAGHPVGSDSRWS